MECSNPCLPTQSGVSQCVMAFIAARARAHGRVHSTAGWAAGLFSAEKDLLLGSCSLLNSVPVMRRWSCGVWEYRFAFKLNSRCTLWRETEPNSACFSTSKLWWVLLVNVIVFFVLFFFFRETSCFILRGSYKYDWVKVKLWIYLSYEWNFPFNCLSRG